VSVVREGLLWAARSDRLRRRATTGTVARRIVDRFVAGEDTDSAVSAAARLGETGRLATIDYLSENIGDLSRTGWVVAAYLTLVDALVARRLQPASELSLKLSALGQLADEDVALANLCRILDTATSRGIDVTVDMEGSATTDSTLRIVTEVRHRFPRTGVAIQASLRRSLDDLALLATPGARIRLCKGAYHESSAVAFRTRAEIRDAYVRCLHALYAAQAYPMIATHDPAMIAAAERLARDCRRSSEEQEFQMLMGVRDEEQRRLAGAGFRVRVYVPYGSDWYGYLMRRLAERPANALLIMRQLPRRR
jgi:proline dehydrogenase